MQKGKHRLEILHEEDGSQLLEFIAILPILASIILIGWQFFLVGHTFLVTLNGAREGARALAVCGASAGDANAAIMRAIPGVLRPQMVSASRGGSSTQVQVQTAIPVIDFWQNYQEYLPPVRFAATMRTEQCRR